jgi:cytochrome c peroxidase
MCCVAKCLFGLFSFAFLGLATVGYPLYAENPGLTCSPGESGRSAGGPVERELRLPDLPYNYSKIELPVHFQDVATQLDNTPVANPLTDNGATLGRVLFYDKTLSVNGKVSCASCHQQSAAFTDEAKLSTGFDGRKVSRNSMSLVNVRYYASSKFFWDERADGLEKQVLMPIENPVEMGHQIDKLVVQLQDDPIYPPLFEKAFGTSKIDATLLARALAQFVRSIVSYQSPYDVGRQEVTSVRDPFPNFSEKENHGKALFFGESRCAICHVAQFPPHPAAVTDYGRLSSQPVTHPASNVHAKYSGGGYSNDFPELLAQIARVEWNQTAFFYMARPLVNGVDGVIEGADGGQGAETKLMEEVGRFKAPSLRNVAVTGPYMHDGRFVTLEAVVEHYNWSVRPHPNLDHRIADLPARGLAMEQAETEAVVAFLTTLTDPYLLRDERFSDPFVAVTGE